MALDVEVAYAASSGQQWLIAVTLTSNATVLTAIEQSNLLNLCPEIDLLNQKVGIFGNLVDLTTVLKTGDRIEIYRPLLIDPMTRRFRQLGRKKI